MNPEKTGALISQKRKEKQMTQKDLANKIGVTDKAISRWETGKGYPDIEILPSLSNALSVTLTELLNGEAVPQEKLVSVADMNLNYVCNDASEKRKKYKRNLIGILFVLFISFVAVGLLIAANIHMNNKYVASTDNCVVASDYSYIMYYDEKYIPLDTGYIAKDIPSENGAYDCEIGTKLVLEAKVEDSDLITKIPFGGSLHSVKGVKDDDIIFLETDYDDLSTQYYVKESKHEYYSSILSDAVPNDYYVQIEQKDWLTKTLAVNDFITEAITEAEKGEKITTVKNSTDRSMGEDYIPVIAFEENHIFYQFKGEILYKRRKYYWYGYQGLPDYTAHPYLIDESYYDELDEIFKFLYK